MPFRVEFELTSKDSRILWTKAISAIHTISDSFKIVIHQGTSTGFDEVGNKCYTEVEFITMNKTKTTILNVSFQECFFKKFSIDGEIIDNSNGGNNNNKYNDKFRRNHSKSYTIVVNSHDMNVLFKDCGEDATLWKIFMIAGDEIAHMIYSNKLFVEFNMKSGMTKKYSITFRPGININDSKIHCIYLQTLENQNKKDNIEDGELENGTGNGREDDDFDMFDEEDERIHRIAVNTLILKRFLQSFPTSLEDFQIAVNAIDNTISFKGYNRQQITSKLESLSNKPMTLSIKMGLDQLIYSNIKVANLNDDETGADGADKRKENQYSVSFRLKNFKTFIQIISGNISIFQDDGMSSNNGKQTNTAYEDVGHFGDDHNICDVMFSKPGYPVIFERRYFVNDVSEMLECSSVTLTEMTDGESGKLVLEGINSNINDKIVNLTISESIKNADNHKLNVSRMRSTTPSNTPRDNILEMDKVEVQDEPLFVAEDGEDDYNDNINDDILQDIGVNAGESRRKDFEQIFWGNNKYHQSRVVEKRRNHGEEERADYEGGDGEEKEKEDDNYLGPTQNVEIKGIFD